MKKSILLCLLALVPCFASDNLGDAIKDGSLILNLRFRVEAVDEQGRDKEAFANTLRTRLGYQTDTYYGWRALIEFENVTVVGDERYNDTVNGDTRFPVVADPSDSEVNRASLAYEGFDSQIFTLGRQRIVLDNARFIGNVGWRQNEQTFDALLWQMKKAKRMQITLGYLDNANRIFGDSHPRLSDLRMESFIANAKFEIQHWGNLAVFTYLFDFKHLPGLAHKNLGVRFDGKHTLSEEWFWKHDLSYVDQSDYADGNGSIDAAYYSATLGFGKGPISFHVTKEVLEGNGNYAFVTPLATLHAFNGWADRFLATPSLGLVDQHIVFDYKQHGWRFLIKGHQFESDSGSLDYGTEIDGLASKKISKRVNVGLKFADYQADDFSTDITKIWGFGQYSW